MKKLKTLMFTISFSIYFIQVSINAITPKAAFDIMGKNGVVVQDLPGNS